MKYLFNRLEEITTSIQVSLTETERLALITDLIEESNLIKTELQAILFNSWADREFEKFTALHHHNLLKLLTNIHRLLEIEGEKKKLVLLAQEPQGMGALVMAYCLLRSLLTFIQTYFERFIPMQQVIPEFFSKPMVQELGTFKDYIEGKLQVLPAKLTKLVLKPFSNFLDYPEKRTWHNLVYCRLLHKEICKLADSEISEEKLFLVLFYLNYNSTAFYRYYTGHIGSEEQELLLTRLYFYRKLVRQMVVKANIAYKPEKKGLRELVEHWLAEEILYQECIAKCDREQPVRAKPPENTVTKPKLTSNFSVAKLAYKARVEVETGFLKTVNLQDLFETWVDTYRTESADNISMTSFRSKFYTTEAVVKKALKEYYITCLNYINSDS